MVISFEVDISRPLHITYLPHKDGADSSSQEVQIQVYIQGAILKFSPNDFPAYEELVAELDTLNKYKGHSRFYTDGKSLFTIKYLSQILEKVKTRHNLQTAYLKAGRKWAEKIKLLYDSKQSYKKEIEALVALSSMLDSRLGATPALRVLDCKSILSN